MTPSLLRPVPRKDQRLSRWLRATLLMGTLLSGVAAAHEAVSPALLLGGSFERPPIHRFLPGSQQTILYPAWVSENGTTSPLTGGMGLRSWEGFMKEWRDRTSIRLATLDPDMIRDARGVIQMAVIATDDPCTASCILMPGFLKRFSAVFGPELILAVPSRSKIYVFPKLANRLPLMAQAIRDDYLISPMPVSTELFELSKRGLRAIGTVDPASQ